MPDYHVMMQGTVGSVGGKVSRELVVRDVSGPIEAEQAALRAVSATGLDNAVVTGVYLWTKGEVKPGYMGPGSFS
jgi:hypothetical protein